MSLTPFTQQELRFIEAKALELFIQSWSDAAREIRIMGFTKEGPFTFKHTTNANRSLADSTFPLSGLPLALEAIAWVTPLQNGRCFINLFLRAGGIRLFSLGSGYLSDGYQISWPPAQHQPMGSGPGYLRSITGTDPAAGAEISEAVPINARWRLRSIRFTFVTDATVATRGCSLTVDDGVTVLMYFPPNQTQAASLTRRYTGAHIGHAEATGYVDGIVVPLPPDLMLFQGWRIRTSTVGLQAGDNYGAPQLLVEEWLEE